MRFLLLVALFCLCTLSSLAVHTVDLRQVANEQAHRTSGYRPFKPLHLNVPLVVRRGQYIEITIAQGASLNAVDTNNVQASVRGQNAQVARVDAQTVRVTIPADAAVGEQTLRIQSDGNIDNQIIVLFNPYDAADTDVYLANGNQQTEYVDRDDGYIWSSYYFGSNYYQYDHFRIMWDVIHLMSTFNGGRVNSLGPAANNANSASHVASWWAKWIRRGTGRHALGFMEARWSGRYDTHRLDRDPTDWTRARDIFDTYRQRQPVKLAQCFVFGFVLNGVYRALGIPSRAISTMESCHPEKIQHVVTRTDEIWNFHVWNEVWVNTNNAGRAWHIVDGTYSIEAIRRDDVLNNNNLHNRFVSFVVDEVKAPIHKASYNGNARYRNADSPTARNTGLYIYGGCASSSLTLAVGSQAGYFFGPSTDNVRDLYRNPATGMALNDRWGYTNFLEEAISRDSSLLQRLVSKRAALVTRTREKGKPVLEIKTSPVQLVAGDTINIKLVRNDEAFFYDAPVKAKVFIVVTESNGNPLELVEEKEVQVSLAKNADLKSAALKLEPSLYLKFFALAPHFTVTYAFYGAEDPAPTKELVMQQFSTEPIPDPEDQPSQKETEKPKEDPSAPKKEKLPAFDFYLRSHFTIEHPPFAVLPLKSGASKEDYVKIMMGLVKEKLSAAKPNSDLPQTKAALEALLKGTAGFALSGAGSVEADTELHMVAVMPNTLGITLNNVVITITLPSASGQETLPTITKVGAQDAVFVKLPPFKLDARELPGAPQLITVTLRCAEISTAKAQTFVAIAVPNKK